MEKRHPDVRERMRGGEKDDETEKQDREPVSKLRASIPFHVFPLFGAAAVI